MCIDLVSLKQFISSIMKVVSFEYRTCREERAEGLLEGAQGSALSGRNRQEVR